MIKYKGKEHKFTIQMFRLFELQKKFEQPLFECFTDIETGKDIEKSYYLMYLCIDTEDSFDEFCNNFLPVDLVPALVELFKELIPMFVTNKEGKATKKK